MEPEVELDAEGNPVEPKEPPKKPDPSALTREDILGLVRESVTASIRALQAERTAAPLPDPEIEDVTDPDLEAAISNGTGSAASIRKAIKAESERLARKLLKERIDPLQATGSKALGRLALKAAASDMPYYERFKNELNQAALNTPPDRVGDPDYLIEVHDYLVGRNWKAIRQEEDEKRAREAERPKGTQTGGAGGRAGLRAVGGGTVKGGKLRPEDVFTEDELASLLDLGKNKNGRPSGKSFEQFCHDVLGKDPDEYLREVLKDRESLAGGAA